MRDEKELQKLLSEAKEIYKDNAEELARRLDCFAL